MRSLDASVYDLPSYVMVYPSAHDVSVAVFQSSAYTGFGIILSKLELISQTADMTASFLMKLLCSRFFICLCLLI